MLKSKGFAWHDMDRTTGRETMSVMKNMIKCVSAVGLGAGFALGAAACADSQTIPV